MKDILIGIFFYVLAGILSALTLYGVWKIRRRKKQKIAEAILNQRMKWFHEQMRAERGVSSPHPPDIIKNNFS